MIRSAVLVIVLLLAPLASAGDISGFWKHAEESAWIEIRMDQGSGTVIRNDLYPERVGRKLLKELVADQTEADLWHGQVYAEKLGEYKKAEISLPEPDSMRFKVKVGFISRTVEWVRVDAVPAVSGD